MKAKDFQKRLIGYEKERQETGKSHFGFALGNVDIHHIGDETTAYTIHTNDKVIVRSVNNYYDSSNTITIDELKGDDFELFSIIHVVKCGYLLLQSITPTNTRKIIGKLHEYLEKHADGDVNTPYLCGGTEFHDKGITDNIAFYDVNGIEVHVETVRHFAKVNSDRKHYGAKYIPFKSSMDNDRTIHVYFVFPMNNVVHKEVYQKARDSVKNLLSYMKDIDVECKWLDSKIQKTIYL